MEKGKEEKAAGMKWEREGRKGSSVFRLAPGLYTSDRDGRCDEAFERHAILRLAEMPSKAPKHREAFIYSEKYLLLLFTLEARQGEHLEFVSLNGLEKRWKYVATS